MQCNKQAQQGKNAELLAVFDKNNPSNSVTLGKTQYTEISTNSDGTTKLFDTTKLSDTELQKDVFDYAQKLAGGKAVTPHPTASGVWNVKLADGTNINVRAFPLRKSVVGQLMCRVVLR